MLKFLLCTFLFTTLLFSSSNIENKTIKLLGFKKDSISKRLKIRDLTNLSYKEFKIKDPYLKKDVVYGGVLLNKFIDAYAKTNVSKVIITAIDDYQITLYKKDWKNNTILLASKIDGHYSSYQERGPLRVIYPDYDSSLEKYNKNLVNWIWMIKSIEFK
ncbi:MAG: hypothetical protein HRT40_06875 [Campylobacteraceae bacterium]|nr:hypothetical protein [Campylobacteraceae bacterium]